MRAVNLQDAYTTGSPVEHCQSSTSFALIISRGKDAGSSYARPGAPRALQKEFTRQEEVRLFVERPNCCFPANMSLAQAHGNRREKKELKGGCGPIKRLK